MVQIVLQTSDTFPEMLSTMDTYFPSRINDELQIDLRTKTLCPKPFKFWITLFMFQLNVRPIYLLLHEPVSKTVPTLNYFVHVGIKKNLQIRPRTMKLF